MPSAPLTLVSTRTSFRDGQKRGTRSACEGIRVIFSTLPHLDWLRWVLNDAEDLARQQSWEPVEPDALLELIRVSDARVVLDDDHLLELAVESLRRYEKRLRTETPAVEDLWYPSNDSWKPRDEEAFSNHVKRYLEDELAGHKIVVNREVQVRKGQATDIHIDAIRMEGDRPAGLLKVIVESKGCWNNGLKSEMKTQLSDRYLSGSDCTRGIYLVAWFLCDEWDHEDYRKGNTPQTTLDDFQAQLDNQADALSGDSKRISAVVVDCRYGAQPAETT